MKDTSMSLVPVPEDLNSIVAIHDGQKWILNITYGTVTLNDGVLSFMARWKNRELHFTLATDIVGGYQCNG